MRLLNVPMNRWKMVRSTGIRQNLTHIEGDLSITNLVSSYKNGLIDTVRISNLTYGEQNSYTAVTTLLFVNSTILAFQREFKSIQKTTIV